jgi:1,2-diacylglycerol 3-beta-galactosyltransferase
VPRGAAQARVLVLFSDTGGGHRAAATALVDALRLLEPEAAVTTSDPLIDEGPRVVRRLASLYSPLIQRSRAAWGALYYSSNTRPTFGFIRALFGRQVRSVISDLLRREDADVVISVHPLLNHVTWQAIQRLPRRPPLVTVITDLVEVHQGWSFKRADLVVVPTEAAREACLKRHVPADRIRLLGLPVNLRFRPPAPGERLALRRAFGLEEDRFTILVTGGGEGSGRLLEQVGLLAWQPRPWQVIAVCGRNEKLRRRLTRLRFRTPLLVLGFVDNMPELMRASDVLIGKAGPGAIGEALATGIPIVLTSYLPGQETENVAFVTEAGIGRYAPSADRLLEAISELTADSGRVYREMSAKASELSRPYASLDIARESLRLASAYRAASQGRR